MKRHTTTTDEHTQDRNTDEYAVLGKAIASAVDDINWIKGISKMILLTILTYFLSIGYYVITLDRVAPQDVMKLEHRITKNTEGITKIGTNLGMVNGKLNVILNVLTVQPQRTPNEWKRSK